MSIDVSIKRILIVESENYRLLWGIISFPLKCSTDLQQHAYELEAVIGLDAHAVEIIMPADASCEDIEVIYKCRIFLFLLVFFLGHLGFKKVCICWAWQVHSPLLLL